VLFEKGREQRHEYGSTMFYTPTFSRAALYAITLARDLRHTPLVIEGEVKKEKEWSFQLPEGLPFVVKNTHIIVDQSNWKSINLAVEPFDESSLEALFTYITRKKILLIHHS